MKPKSEKKIEEEKKIKDEATKARRRARNASDAVIYGTTATGQLRYQTPSWHEMTKREKVKEVFSLIFILAAVIYVVFALQAQVWFPGSYFAKIFSNETIEPTGKWYIDSAKPILQTIFYFLLIIGLAQTIRIVLILVTRKGSKKTVTIVKLINSSIKYLSWIVMVFAVLGVWGVNTSAIIASAGIVALVIGLGAQSLIADVIGGLAIVFEQEFEVGDTVVIDEFRGVVTEIGLATTKITDAAGNTKTIHNSGISSAINLSQDNSIAVCDIPVDYDQDLKTVRELLAANLPAIGKSIPEIIGTPKFLGVQEFQDSGILLRVIATTKEENKFGVTRALNEAVFNLFKTNNVNIPFNQIVVSKRKGSD